MTGQIERAPSSGGVAAGAAIGVGVGLAALTIAVGALLDDEPAFTALAVLLGMIAGAYLGFAAADGRVRALGVESLGITATVVLAILALVLDSPVLLAVGYVGHGLWDVLHHPRALDTVLPRWYPPFCIAYDVVVGLYILLRFA